MRHFILTISTVSCITNVAAQELTLPNSYADNLSFMITNANNGKVVYQYKETEPRLIASNMKLFTTLFGLQNLKPNFQWHTKIYYTGYISNNVLNGNLYIQGGGDPTLTSEVMTNMLAQVKRHGITTINGKVIIDDNIFNSTTKYSMREDDKYDTDTIMPTGLMFDGNLTQFVLHRINNKFSVSTNLFGYKTISYLKVDPSLRECGNLEKRIDIDMTGKSIEFNGKIAKSCNGADLIYNYLANDKYSQMVVNKSLFSNGINVDGKYGNGVVPAHATLLVDKASAPLEQVLIKMNHFSVNLIAETIMLSVGAYMTNNEDTYDDAKQVYNKFLEQNDLMNDDFKLENGAGLSRHEYQSTQNIVHLLDIANQSKYQADFEKSLPMPGQRGTLEFSLLQFRKQLHAKTGTLSDTRAYSGYFYAKSGNKYLISIVMNDINTHNHAQMQRFNNWVTNLLNSLD